MNADELRALQAPLKDSYRNNPAAAVVTLRAEGRMGEGIACRVDTGRALVEAGLHPAKDAPVGFREIRLRFELDTSATAEQRKKLIELTERYCVVLQTIRKT